MLIVRSAFTCIAQELNRRIGSAMRDLYLEHIEFNLASEVSFTFVLVSVILC
ncbi:unnamed protein product [Trichobilharzia regenti]|nr:unnamed protein product [Trichobilharzia regenti]